VLSNLTTSTGFPAPPARPENGEAPAAVLLGDGVGAATEALVDTVADVCVETGSP